MKDARSTTYLSISYICPLFSYVEGGDVYSLNAGEAFGGVDSQVCTYNGTSKI